MPQAVKQLAFEFADEPRAVVQMMPQPIQNGWGCVFRGDYIWWHGRHSATCTSDPSQSDTFLRCSPYQIGDAFEEYVIESVAVRDTRQLGWVWVLKLRSFVYEQESPELFWEDLKPPPGRSTVCEHCGCYEDKDPDGDNYLYDVPPIDGDFGPSVLEPQKAWVLCWDCKEEHVSYWGRVLTSVSA
jgi:hypothetical protein